MRSAIVVLLAVLAAGCGDGGPADESGRPPSDRFLHLRDGAVREPVRGQYSAVPLVFAVPLLEDSLHSLLLGPPNWRHLVYEPLVRAASDSSGFEPCLARSWQVSADSLVWTFCLRPNVRWSNPQVGSDPPGFLPLTSYDVDFTFLRLASEGYPQFAARAWRLGAPSSFSVETPSADTVRIKLSEPDAVFLERLSLLGITSVRATAFLRGTGPFVLVSRADSTSWVFRRHGDYWRYDLDGRQLPYSSVLRLEQETEPAGYGTARFRAGTQLAMKLSPNMVPEMVPPFLSYTEPYHFRLAYLHGLEDGLSLRFREPSPADTTSVAACKAEWLRSADFRQAVGHAIDRAELLRRFGSRGRLWQPLPGLLDFDRGAADSLLAGLGLVDNDRDGFREDDAHGHRVRLTAATSGNALSDHFLREQLAACGIDVELVPRVRRAFPRAASRADLVLGTEVWGPPGSLQRALFLWEAAPQARKATLSADFRRAFSARDPVRRYELFEAVEQSVWASLQQIPLLKLRVYLAGHDELRHWNPSRREPHNWHNVQQLYVRP